MRAVEPAWATRFYGMPVTPEIAAAAHDHLIDPEIADLVDAHLAINDGYVGAIDKTLAGFVVLDGTGDDFTLLDLRDGRQVWWQDHETRELAVQYDTLGDLVATRDELAHAEAPEVDRETIIARRRSAQAKASRAVTTPALCARYQWLVWFYAQPLARRGVPVQSIDYLVRSGIGSFRHVWPSRDVQDAAFEAEVGELSHDPHLAIYWLLHATALADRERAARVVAELGAGGCELVRAFGARLGALPLWGDLSSVPEFRARRALAATYGAFELAADEVPVACLRALEISPATSSLLHALQVVAGLDRGVLDPALVTAVFGRIPETTSGTELVRAVLDKRSGLAASKRADELARLVAAGLGVTDPWWHALEAMWQTHELAYDGRALVAATREIVARDRFHRRALQMAMRAAQIAGDPIDALYADLAIADGIVVPFQRVTDTPARWQEVVDALAPPFRRGFAWRVLQRVQLNKPAPGLVTWAASRVLGEPGGDALVGAAFASLDAQTQLGVVESAREAIVRADDPLITLLAACLRSPDPAPHDHVARTELVRARQAALVALAPWAHESPLFGLVMELVERPGPAVDLVWATLFNPFEKATFVVPRLDDAQAVRAVRAMIATRLRHPAIQARNSAGHQLSRFSHRGAETCLIDALSEYTVRLAAVKRPGGAVLDHGKTENDQLEDLVADLYEAVRQLATPTSREALVERLFAERRAYRRMGNAIGAIWDPALHARVMELLAERRDARAAGCYAYALHDFVKQGAPLIDLARLVVEWQGDTELARRFLHYALVIGIEAALGAHDDALVRRIHEAAAWIAESPLEPDQHARGTDWHNPLERPETKAALAAVLAKGETVTAKKPAAKKPAAKKPAAKKSAAKKPATKKPAAKKPAAKKPAAKKPAAKPAPKPTSTKSAKAASVGKRRKR